jgi:putative methyltransferase (TIGR04325 family)
LPSRIANYLSTLRVRKLFSKPRSIQAPTVNLAPWRGSYTNWQLAIQASTGYDVDIILDKVSTAISKVKKGEAVYERDSVLFEKIQYSWPLLTCLLKVASANHSHLRILDFGGSLGSTYFQNEGFLNPDIKITWNIVEQKRFVEKGKSSFESDQLHFHNSLEESQAAFTSDCVLFSGVLQYLSDPYTMIRKYLSENFEYIIIDRTAFIKAENERITVQEVPKFVYEASYPCWFFNENKFLSIFSARYRLIADFPSFADPDLQLEDGSPVYWKGFFFKRK